MLKSKIILILTCFICTINVFADEQNDEIQKEYDDTAKKAKTMSNREIIREVGFIYDMDGNKSPLQTSFKVAPYVAEITEREAKGDIEAKYISNSLWKKTACELMIEQKMKSIGDSCTSVIEDFKYIANINSNKPYVASSMVALGDIYRDGVVSSKSNLLSSEWYYKAAVKYNSLGNRDEAVKSLEKSIQSTPNYKPALKLLDSISGSN